MYITYYQKKEMSIVCWKGSELIQTVQNLCKTIITEFYMIK